ncbi:APC family permease [Desulfovibrio mangrovi]|uniref:APC family permease n=1 Tax=Desulfovibrio mangrovi TaxID=2976983 RepID=UPI002247EB21|nr:APC family permease [Desulfovibrio mangrovi]UZP67991.1 APC family permease [Desulfovibrio mangrovi]
MKNGKLGPFMLSGLMVGPVLGSGIFILPPLVQQAAGEWAVPAWLVTVFLNAVFAFVFGFLSIQFPGNGGVADAIAHVFGARAKRLASYYLISAVIFGPAAVLLTIAQYLPLPWLDTVPGGRMGVALCLVPFGFILLLQRIRAIGTIALVVSSVSAVLLFAGSVLVVLTYGEGMPLVPRPASFDAGVFGHSLLMLFWIIVGWEVVGNYSGDVDGPKRTIPRAVMGSVAAVTAVELCVAFAMQAQAVPQQAGYGVARMLYPMFGPYGGLVCSLLVTALCVTTYLMFVGGVARLMASLADDGALPAAFGKTRGGVPVVSVAALCLMQAGSLVACLSGLARLESLVAIASGFFLANALIGIGTGIVMLSRMWKRVCAALLAVVLLVVFGQSEWFVLFAVGVLAIWCLKPVSRVVSGEESVTGR